MEFLKLKSCIDNLVDNENAPGADCVVYKNHELVFRYYTGKSDLENNTNMNGDELYFIFSMTKMITCVSALQLFEKGKFDLDEPVFHYLPEFKKMRISIDAYNDNTLTNIMTGKSEGESVETNSVAYASNQITIRHLFTMTAGLNYDLNSDGIKRALSKNKKSTRELVGAISETVLSFEPGTRFRYSLCHDVLGGLIEIWSGKKLGEYMKENIFDPLGMKDTFFSIPKDKERLNRMAARYKYDENKNIKRMPLECCYNWTENYESGGAGLISSALDYALFLDALANKGVGKNGSIILSESSIKLMQTCQISGKPLEDFDKLRPGYGYGLGVRTHIDKFKSGSLSPIGEFGWDGAAGAFSLVDTENDLSLTYFRHVHNWDIKMQTELRNALYTDLLGQV